MRWEERQLLKSREECQPVSPHRWGHTSLQPLLPREMLLSYGFCTSYCTVSYLSYTKGEDHGFKISHG